MAGQAAMLGLASFITANPPATPLSSLTTPDTPSPMPTLLLPDMFGFAGSELQSQGGGDRGWEQDQCLPVALLCLSPLQAQPSVLPLRRCALLLSTQLPPPLFSWKHPWPLRVTPARFSLLSQSAQAALRKHCRLLSHFNSLQCCVLGRVQTLCAKVECFGGNDESHSH